MLKYYHVIDLLLYVRFFVHRSRKSISSIALYSTRGNGGSDLPPFGFKWGDVLKCGHNRKITPLCTDFVHRSRDFTSSTAFYPTR